MFRAFIGPLLPCGEPKPPDSQIQDRPDSNSEEKMRRRLDQFNEETAPALEFLRSKGLVKDVNGERAPADIAEDIEKLLAV